jgi:hypothetical protein
MNFKSFDRFLRDQGGLVECVAYGVYDPILQQLRRASRVAYPGG